MKLGAMAVFELGQLGFVLSPFTIGNTCFFKKKEERISSATHYNCVEINYDTYVKIIKNNGELSSVVLKNIREPYKTWYDRRYRMWGY